MTVFRGEDRPTRAEMVSSILVLVMVLAALGIVGRLVVLALFSV